MAIVIPSLVALLSAPVAAWAAQAVDAGKDDRTQVVDGSNAFAIDLYGQLRGRSGNLFFSPESISTALAMTYAGARGQTAEEMAKTLHFTLPPDRLHPAMGALLNDLNAAHTGYRLTVANALWTQQGYTFLGDFTGLMKSDYGAGFNRSIKVTCAVLISRMATSLLSSTEQPRPGSRKPLNNHWRCFPPSPPVPSEPFSLLALEGQPSF